MGIPYTVDQIGLKVGRPRVTITLIVINVIAYAITSLDYGFMQISGYWLWFGGFVPAYLADVRQLYRFLTSMFLHGHFLHIFFNMLFLYNFGRHVENALGGKRFLALYLLSGLAASIFHAAFIPIEGAISMAVPAVGASGAISGLLGAYLLLFPGSKLTMCFFYLFFPVCFTASASAYLIFWFIMQVIEGYARTSTGVAVFAHAGGFLAGMALLPRVINRERHHLLRALTASQRAFKYLFLGSTGLGHFSKLFLMLAISAVAVGSLFSAVAVRGFESPVKVISLSTSYNVYCSPGDYLCDTGYSEDFILIRLNGVPRLLSEISSPSVRIVFNRLEALNVIFDKGLAGSTTRTTLKKTAIVMGVPVNVELNMNASYDEIGVLDTAEGIMKATVLTCSGGTCYPSGNGEFEFMIKTFVRTKRNPLLVSILTTFSALSIVTCLLALDSLLRKAHELELVV
ncbi:MAG: rhomboid family intramembrane serine protease [Thermofilaceae archaeon]|nr:rhomboid family intramembrane serine protease [Thermofilaceae archaeon]MCX8180152.1 rhomboid family intramembrane serine protease [Thermofilaceae archaeon]MDW8004192.1 rhomboid family intramembrane serine protease [Thermofilaceae archaeon]